MGSLASLRGRFWCLIAATFLGFVGFVIGTFSVIALCSRPFAGRIADRRGRKSAFLAGLGSCSLAGVAYLLPWGVSAMYVGRALQGIGEACLYTGAAAWAVEVAGVHR